MKRFRQYTRPFALSLLIAFFSLAAHHNSVALGAYTTSPHQNNLPGDEIDEGAIPGILAAVGVVAYGAVVIGAFVIGAVNGYYDRQSETQAANGGFAFVDHDYNGQDFSQFDN